MVDNGIMKFGSTGRTAASFSSTMKVVIVDDSELSCLLLKSFVQQLDNLEIPVFTDPVSALRWCYENNPDLIILDYQMPVMNGLEFLRRFLEYPDLADVPVLMVTGEDDRAVFYEALEVGVTDFLKKPIDAVEVKARIRNTLKLRARRKRLQENELVLNAHVAELEELRGHLEAQARNALKMSEELGHAREQLNDAVESISEGFALWGTDDCLIMCNNRYRNLYPDLSNTFVPGASFADFVRAAYKHGIFSLDGDDLAAAVQDRVIRHQSSVSAFEQELGDGRWVRVSKRKTKSGHTVAILSDITGRIESEATIRRMAIAVPERSRHRERRTTASLSARS